MRCINPRTTKHKAPLEANGPIPRNVSELSSPGKAYEVNYEGTYRHACGKCLPCLMTRVENLTFRMVAESMCHQYSWFISLTYSDEHLPDDFGLHKDEFQKFMKRMRRYSGIKMRYFGCGEYGHKNGRPHFHAIIYGVPSDFYINKYGKFQSRLLDKAWKKGFHNVQLMSPKNARYVAKYAVKKYMPGNDVKLNGREPEFVLRSTKPGIGADYMLRLANKFQSEGLYFDTYDGTIHLADLPSQVRVHGKKYPLDHYLKSQLRKYLDGNEPTFFETLFRSEQRIREIQQEYEMAPDLYHDADIASLRAAKRYFKIG